MIESHDYSVDVRWTTESTGFAESPEGLPPLEVAAPPEFGGPTGVWSPEHLFVASVASCFATTFRAIAALSKLDHSALEVQATGTLVRGEDRKYRISRVLLRPRMTLSDEGHRERAQRIVEKAEAACLITNSIRTDVRVVATFETAEPAETATVGSA
ncbi:MAG: OsmC family protein [Thermoanaerobaculia bacterium]|nr:OsmC family protein [Thermoanaerobaculia bacterium]